MECNNNSSNSRSSSKRSSSTPANSRWNPTSPQINLLEGLYNQGLRTPTPDQIQQIAAMLSAYGHIEGKNVFYWFQNHKARQRQKLKQDIIDITTTTATNHHNSNNNNHNLPFINHHQYFLRNSHLPPPHHQPTAPPMMCGSYYAPEADEVRLRRRPQHPNNVVVVPAGSGFKGMRKAQTSSDKIKRTVAASAAAAYHDHHRTVPDSAGLDVHDDHDHQTLPLFPLHPTGGLLGRANLSSSSPPPSYVIPDNNSSSIDDTGVSGDDNTTTAAVGCCFDFFSLGQSHVCPPHRF